MEFFGRATWKREATNENSQISQKSRVKNVGQGFRIYFWKEEEIFYQ